MTDLITFTDIGEVSSREKTPEGFLRVVADFARAGIQEYRAGEIPYSQLPRRFRDDPYQVVRVLRPAEEVFDKAAMRSFALKPVTNNHPPRFVDAKNFKKHAVGTAQDKIERVEDRLRVGLILQDQEAIDEVEAGKDQLSAGYSSRVVWGAGDDPVFGHYDAKQTAIRGNHIAVVDKARGGPEIRINDSWPSATKPEKGIKMAERTINGIAIEFSDQGCQAVDHLVTQADKTAGKVAALEAQLTDAQAANEKLQGELDAQKSAQLTDEDVEAKVSERLEVIDDARKLHPKIEVKGKTLTEIKTEAIKHADKAFEFKKTSADYVDGVFESFVAKAPDTSKESLRKATQSAGFTDSNPDIAGDAQRKFTERNENAWKGGDA
jgi:hypothetical protein